MLSGLVRFVAGQPPGRATMNKKIKAKSQKTKVRNLRLRRLSVLKKRAAGVQEGGNLHLFRGDGHVPEVEGVFTGDAFHVDVSVEQQGGVAMAHVELQFR